jgi:hypothetical protein
MVPARLIPKLSVIMVKMFGLGIGSFRGAAWDGKPPDFLG